MQAHSYDTSGSGTVHTPANDTPPAAPTCDALLRQHDRNIQALGAQLNWSAGGALDVDDLCQAARLACLKAAQRWAPEKGTFWSFARPWARYAMLREVSRQLRTIKQPERALTSRKQPRPGRLVLTGLELGADAPDPAPDPEAQAIAKQRSEALNAAIAQLPRPERDALCLRLRGWTDAKIGKALGISRVAATERVGAAQRTVAAALSARKEEL